MLADRKLMQTALAQLVDNAVKYSEPASPIGIAVALIDQEVTVTIESQGDRITPADCERVFDRFYRGAGAADGPPGTGLGTEYRQADRGCAPGPRLGGKRGGRQVDILDRPAGHWGTVDDVAGQHPHHRRRARSAPRAQSHAARAGLRNCRSGERRAGTGAHGERPVPCRSAGHQHAGHGRHRDLPEAAPAGARSCRS